MSVKNEKSAIEDILSRTLAEAKEKGKGFPFGKKDDDKKDDNKSDDGAEDGEKEEKDEDKKVKVMKKKSKKDDDNDKANASDKDNDKSDDEDDVTEETDAASSLHPAARSISDAKSLTKSKIGMMQHMMGAMNGMSKGDLTDWFTKTMAQFGPGKTYGVGDNSGKNSSSIDMKASGAVSSKGPKTKDGMPKLDSKGNPLETGKGMKFSVKEDVESMFEGQEISEEFKEEITTIFEAAIAAKLTVEVARLEEEYEEMIQEEVNALNEKVTEKIDSYLDYVVESWMEENKVAIESTLRNELMTDFMEGLKGLFAEHYIEVPETKIDVLESLADKVAVLEQKLDETITENTELKNLISEANAEEVFEELASDLVLSQQEKFKALAEGIEFDGDLETYTKKLKIVKENYFKADTTVHTSNINEETFEGELTESTKSVDPQINRYVNALSRTVKK